jgi:hypothetical protein
MAVLGATSGLGGCMSGATYGTGEVPEMAVFREMTGGLASEKKKPIEYQPRAPLVMPPAQAQATLPAPVTTADATAGSTAWPQDPDQTKRSKDYGPENARTAISQADYDRLKPLGALARNDGSNRPAIIGGNEDHNDHPAYAIVHSKQQQVAVRTAMDEANGLGPMKERRYLTDPPDTLRQPAASAPAEFDDIKKKHQGNWFAGLFGG